MASAARGSRRGRSSASGLARGPRDRPARGTGARGRGGLV